MKRLKSSKGFTLMEMLIVVAIIAVLVAIAIPTFTTSLNKARLATDQANIRSGYAAAMARVLTEQITTEGTNGNAGEATYFLMPDGTVKTMEELGSNKTNVYKTKGTLNDADGVIIAGYKFTEWEKGKKVTYSFTGANNKVTISVDGISGSTG